MPENNRQIPHILWWHLVRLLHPFGVRNDKLWLQHPNAHLHLRGRPARRPRAPGRCRARLTRGRSQARARKQRRALPHIHALPPGQQPIPIPSPRLTLPHLLIPPRLRSHPAFQKGRAGNSITMQVPRVLQCV